MIEEQPKICEWIPLEKKHPRTENVYCYHLQMRSRSRL